MARYRPAGVILLGIYLILYALVAFSMAQGYLGPGNPSGPFSGYDPVVADIGNYALGIIYLFIAATRLIAAFGVLSLKRRAWKTAFVLITMGMIMDLLQAHGIPLFLGAVALIYLIYVRDHFRYS